MSNKKQFGVWMDTHEATIVVKDLNDNTGFEIVGTVKGEKSSPNSSEKTGNNHEQALTTKYFKEIAAMMTNATHIHVTGTGQVQEQFIHYLSDTPQWKNTIAEESTSNKMSDEKLMEYLEAHLK